MKVKDKGGRNHTFTEVVEFGGRRVEALNFGLTPLMECGAAAAPVLLPGASTVVSGLSVGNHRFQCCLHPRMRTVIKVIEDD